MFLYFATLLCICLTICQADIPVSPPLRCGAMPRTVYSCLSTPKILKSGISAHCKGITSECEKITCLFEESGWLNNKVVDQVKLRTYFEDFGKHNPSWNTAVEYVKTNCLNGDLPAQGIYLNCPAYDVMQCAFSSFIKNAPSSEWSTASRCDYPRQFAASCPVCPSDCFEPLIPIGSCNACLALPRSP